jgi:hypothetical protein
VDRSKILEGPLGDFIVALTAETRRAARNRQEIRVLIVNSLRDVFITRAWSSTTNS